MKLFTYFRSSAAYRVRIALNLKGLRYESVAVHLVRNGGEQYSSGYSSLNPACLVPTLVDGDVTTGQSMAIIEYLDELYPEPPLLPADPAGRARVRAIAQNISCDLHPLNNLRVLEYLTHVLGTSEAQKKEWYFHWLKSGLAALENVLAGDSRTGTFCHEERPTLADCCLIPQLYNARRFGFPLECFPTLLRIDAACTALVAFQESAPERQADAET